MAKKQINHFRLGLFVIAGLGFLILLLYMIGKNQNLFGSTFPLRVRFENVHGLMPGNSVRFAGIDAGTVDEVRVINDTTIEVSLLVKTKMRPHIKKNASASIGTDGLMGNKLVYITAEKGQAAVVEDNDLLGDGAVLDTDEMMKTLSKTNQDVSVIAEGLKETVNRINNSKALWTLLNDESLPQNIRLSVSNARQATEGTRVMVTDLQGIVADVRNGKGSVGGLLKDTAFLVNLQDAVTRIRNIGIAADTLTAHLNRLVDGVDQQLRGGKGTVQALLNDTVMVSRMNNSLANVEKGTAAFNDNMEALKHNFLFRGYFRKLENAKKKEQAAAARNRY